MKGYFSFEELTAKNDPRERFIVSSNKDVFANLTSVCRILNMIREKHGHPVYVTSLFRDSQHNHDAGGSPTSQHLRAAAADISSREGLASLLNAVQKVQERTQMIGQVIVYNQKNIIHVGLAFDSEKSFPFSITFK